MTTKRVLSVGQCGADHYGISSTFRQAFGAEVESASTQAEALRLLRQEPFALVLVNRILDADGDSGVDLIRQIKADDALRATPVLLVSNYADAHARRSRPAPSRALVRRRWAGRKCWTVCGRSWRTEIIAPIGRFLMKQILAVLPRPVYRCRRRFASASRRRL